MNSLRRSRCRRVEPAVVCAAAGWQLGTATLTNDGTVACPVCEQSVTARHVRPGVIEVAAHPPADAVTCRCGTVHARLDCPACGRRISTAEAVLHGVAVSDVGSQAAGVR